ncbi:uncharacterized protein K452DRAFT_314705, partial [Aplosporella prunicola CBS 121167]
AGQIVTYTSSGTVYASTVDGGQSAISTVQSTTTTNTGTSSTTTSAQPTCTTALPASCNSLDDGGTANTTPTQAQEDQC